MLTIKGSDVKDWLEAMSQRWRRFLVQHPQVLALPCDIRETHTVAELLQHIVAVELRYAQRLNDLEQTAYDAIPCQTADVLYRTHDEAMSLLDQLADRSGAFWEEEIEFTTRSAGTLTASRGTAWMHLLTHSARHYAQLGTLVRQHGFPVDFAMDYLFLKPAASSR